MQCFSPILLKETRQLVPCGRCAACKGNRRQEWAFRLEQQLKTSDSAVFVTLTYSDENLTYGYEGLPILVKSDIQLFFKRFRKKMGKQKIVYYLVGEYGDNTKRPHYHALLFGAGYKSDKLHIKLLETWQQGHVHLGDVTPKSIRYTLKYMLKNQIFDDKELNGFSLMSKGIGKDYIKKAKKYHRGDVYERAIITKEGGYKQRMPRYYREKIFTKLERQIQGKKLQEDYEKKSLNSRESQKEQARLKTERQEAYRRLLEKNTKRTDKI